MNRHERFGRATGAISRAISALRRYEASFEPTAEEAEALRQIRGKLNEMVDAVGVINSAVRCREGHARAEARGRGGGNDERRANGEMISRS